ncbi:MAG TPA: hypothetical protein VFF73_29915, partial [Planctomycetota bacterium]|nr:hypothetical protein [Planctomycetota bacterium]
MNRVSRRVALTIASLLLTVGVARADVVYLSSGGVVKGTIVKETADSITVKTPGGSTSIIPRNDIERIEKGGSPDAMSQLGSIEGSEAAQDFARALADVERELGGAPRCAL